MPRKPWIRCPVCRSGKIWIESYSHKADGHIEYHCLCRGCCQIFILPRKVEGENSS